MLLNTVSFFTNENFDEVDDWAGSDYFNFRGCRVLSEVNLGSD